MNTDSYLLYQRFPQPLPEEVLKDYFYKYKSGDLEARKTIIEHNIKLVLYLIMKYFNDMPYELEDLFEVGLEGLINAVDTFDIDKGYKFSSYVKRCIDFKIYNYHNKEIKYIYRNISIDELIYNSNFHKRTCLENILQDENIDIVGDYEKKELSKILMEIVDELDEEDKKIITLYFGLNQNESYTQKEIAHIFNTRQSTIGKKISRILNSIKDRIVNGKEIKKNYCPEWLTMYKLAKAYYENNKNLEIPQCFKTKNGYEYDEDGVALGEWLKNQKSLYFKGKLDDERKNKLDSIEMNFEKIRKYTK